MPATPIALPSRAPIVKLAAPAIAESAAVRAVVSYAGHSVVLLVRFRVLGTATPTDTGCVAAASRRVVASARLVRVALVPQGVWCAGSGILTVAADRHGARAGVARLHVRPAEARGRGDVVGHLLLGPTCPVERLNDPCDPVAHPEPIVLVALDGSGAEAARTMTLADGSFALDLRPGTYTLRGAAGNATYPAISAASLVVSSDATSSRPQSVVVHGDTGIR